ncbi:hypothetical protein CVT25_004797 [Psilocybe cyanescens]|uniref:Uncharacterized protein n=1 Tax=Psilocybe cyanescens TaxID=93625 RepID=A0A409XGJ8_PSICY|nr:hypothetical protein CVT25_004797 [Psilocybe cyanescens]
MHPTADKYSRFLRPPIINWPKAKTGKKAVIVALLWFANTHASNVNALRLSRTSPNPPRPLTYVLLNDHQHQKPLTSLLIRARRLQAPPGHPASCLMGRICAPEAGSQGVRLGIEGLSGLIYIYAIEGEVSNSDSEEDEHEQADEDIQKTRRSTTTDKHS